MSKCDLSLKNMTDSAKKHWNILQTFENVSQMLPNDFRMVLGSIK